MNWYSHLYVGKKAKKHRYVLIQKIRENMFHPNIYVIIPSVNGNNILDIFPMTTWMLYHKEHPDALIVGIGNGYEDALEVVRRIIDDLYQTTGGFDLPAFLY